MVLNRKEILIIGLLSVLFFMGNSYSTIANVMAVIFIYIYILVTDKENALYLVFFLIPNIRIVDNIGSFTGFLNIAFLLTGIKWVIACRHGINRKGATAASIALFFSIIHLGIVNNIQSYFISVINLVIDIIVMVSILQNSNSNIKIDHIIRYLSLGILISMLIDILVNSSLFSSVFSSNFRLEGYGDDPNYYSMYILTSIALLFDRLRAYRNRITDILMILLLIFVGLLTSSKMFFLGLLIIIMSFTLSVLFSVNKKGFKILLTFFSIGLILFFAKMEDIIFLFDKVIKRFSVISNTNQSVIYSLTTGRSMLFSQYWHVFWDDPITCLVGRGLAYNDYLAPLFGDTRVAHNTYMDLFLSWGIFGGCLFLIFIIGFIRDVLNQKETFSYKYVPLIVFCFTIFALSCLSADMFWYMLLLVLLPLKEKGEVGCNR